MSRHGAIDLIWAGGEHTFRLGLAEIEELEAATDSSVFALFATMNATVPVAHVKHYSETIRLGLMGGGMAPITARVLVRRYVDERPLGESVALAEVILRAAIERVNGVPETEGDDQGEIRASEQSGSTSAPSTPTQPSSESPTSDASVSASTRPSSGDGTRRKAETARKRRRKPSSPQPSRDPEE